MRARACVQADFTVTGNFRAKKFDITDVRTNIKRVIARVAKEGRFSSVTSFLKCVPCAYRVLRGACHAGGGGCWLNPPCLLTPLNLSKAATGAATPAPLHAPTPHP